MANAIFRVLVNGAWVDIPVVQGTDGVSVALRVSGDYLQMKQSDQTEWTNIFDFSTIETVKGDTGNGVSNIALTSSGDNYNLTFTMTESDPEVVSFPKPSNGVGVSNITLTTSGTNYVLTFTMTSGASYAVTFPIPADGYTPVKGTDYWTQADQDAILADCKNYIDSAIENGEW